MNMSFNFAKEIKNYLIEESADIASQRHHAHDFYHKYNLIDFSAYDRINHHLDQQDDQIGAMIKAVGRYISTIAPVNNPLLKTPDPLTAEEKRMVSAAADLYRKAIDF